MATRTGRKIAHYAAGGGALDGTAQGLPAATGGLGYTPGPETNAAGSWGAAAESGGIPGDSSISPVGAPPAWNGGPPGGDYVPPPPPMPAAAPTTYAPALPTPAPYTPVAAGMGWAEGGAIPDKVEHFAHGGRSGHGGFTIPGSATPGYDPDSDLVAKINKQASTHVSRRFTDTAETTAPPGGQQQQEQQPTGSGGGGGKRHQQPQQQPQQTPQTPPPSGSSGWSGGLDQLPSSGGSTPPGAGSTNNDASAPPTDAFGGAPSSGGALPEGSTADQGGASTDAMGSSGGGGGDSGGAMAKGGIVQPKEEPYRQKWRAKNNKKATPYRAYDEGGALPDLKNGPASQEMGMWNKDGSPAGPAAAEMGPAAETETKGGQDVPDPSSAAVNAAEGGAIPDTADIPIDQDQDQEGQTGDENSVYSKVKDVLSQTRQMYGLNDNAFKMAGNMPTKPAGPGGDQTQGGPQDRSNPPPAAQNDNDGDEGNA